MNLEKIKTTWKIIKPILDVVVKVVPGTIDDAALQFIDKVIKEL